MQYQITCEHCHQLYVVSAPPGQTLHSRCPYCNHMATIATPYDATAQDPSTNTPLSSSHKAQTTPFAKEHTTAIPQPPLTNGNGQKSDAALSISLLFPYYISQHFILHILQHINIKTSQRAPLPISVPLVPLPYKHL